MTPQELKESIIRLAMKGQLTSQFEADGSSSVYLEKVIAFKKKNKISDNKKMASVSDDDVPFDIPNNWNWVRFGSIVHYHMGKTPPRAESQWWTSDIPWVSISDMPESDHISSTKEKVSFSAIASVFGNRVSKAGTLLMSFKLTVGRVSILDIDAVHNEAIISIFPYCDEDGIVKSYLFHLLPIISQYGDSKNAIKGKTLNDTSICNLMIPLPPLAEQKRIVAKIEEVLPLIDRYETAWTKLEDFNKRFPIDMQKSILQMAIQGKLVPQDPSEGTGEELYKKIQAEKQELIKAGKIKKEKPLPEINDDEIPFEIPEKWKWTRLIEIAFLTSGNQYNEQDHGVPYLKVADMNLQENRLEITTSSRFTSADNLGIIPSHSIIFPKRGGAIATNKKKIVLKYPVYIDSNSMGMTVIDTATFDYIKVWFDSIDMGKLQSGTSVPQINNKDLYPLLVPLPPLAEQKRIVKKLEELLPLCEKMK